MPWYRVQLCAAGTSDLRMIRSMFEQLYLSAKSPPRMALFSTQWQSGSDALELYFTPGCIDHAPAFLRLLNATPCAPPAVQLKVEIGRHEAWEHSLQASA